MQNTAVAMATDEPGHNVANAKTTISLKMRRLRVAIEDESRRFSIVL
jgi:hypothetical protein